MSSLEPANIDLDQDDTLDLLNALPWIAVVLDSELKLKFANRSFCQFVDQSPEEVAESPLLALLPQETSGKVKRLLEQLSPENSNRSQVIQETPTGDNQFRKWTVHLKNDESNQNDRYYVFSREVTAPHRQDRAPQQDQDVALDARVLRKMTETIQEAFWLIDTNWSDVIYANRACEDVYGVPYEDLLKDVDNWVRYIVDEDAERMYKNLAPNKNEELNETVDVKFRIDHPEKGRRHINLKISPIPENGKTERLVGLASDVTEKEEKLQQSQQKFEAIFNSTVSMIGLLDTDGTIIEVNHSALEMIEEPKEETLGEPFWDSPWWTTKSLQQRMKNAVETAADGEFVQFEANVQLPNGKEATIDMSFTPIENKQGTIEYVVPEGRNITTQKQLENQLEKKTDYLQTILDSAPNLIFVKDWDGVFQIANEALANFYDTTTDDLIGKTDADFNPNEDEVEKFREADRDVMRSGDTKEIPEEPVTDLRSGETRWFQTTKVPLFTDQPVEDRQVLGVATDITEKKDIREQLEQSLEEKEMLLGEIHHRVKNNLQIIQSILSMEIRERDDQNAVLKDCVNRIYSMALLHEKLYQSDTLDTGDISSYFHELSQHLKGAVGTEAQDIDISLSVNLDSIAIKDAVSCGLVVNELVTNALQHGFNDGEEGQIDIAFQDDDENYEITVKDNGHGLPEGVNITEVESTGMRIIRSIVEYEFHGTVDFYENDGVTVEVSL